MSHVCRMKVRHVTARWSGCCKTPATLWLQSQVCDYILDTLHDRQWSPKPLFPLVPAWSAPYRTSGGTVSVTPRSNGSDVQTWIINKEMFGMKQHLGLTNTGIKLHFCWQTESMNLWAHGLIKEFHISKKINMLRIFNYSKMISFWLKFVKSIHC